MKKIFTTLALIGTFITGAVAQKNVNLKFSIVNPANGATYANIPTGDSMNIKFKVENLGTDAVAPTDTLTFWIAGYSFNTASGQSVWRGIRQYGFNIAANQSQEVSYWVTKGSGTVSGTDTTINWFFDNDTNIVVVEGYGRAQGGVLFNDPGVDNSNPDGDGTLTGTNHAESAYILGTLPTSIKKTELTKELISVYPNPAKNEINFDYTFKGATTASVKVFDAIGREVYTQAYGKQQAGKKSFKLDLSSLPNGMYSVELITDNAKAVNKFSIAK
ncbi:hypothetical protein DBR32_13065 [Taibaiella sp. KBW10]|uniref:T9SS type A sorting domain-containing protein n=1 Tax=Taibaiella sp. KBW10 TaxID=2153357 RepID=UPI000F5A34B0|nr:T9SS type A sorting domain-containing protein [Taibaiella sp. KBW10]RQO30490.1 hypothetical protein DBR32_13065 [Taibaiella sp. KBW10]